jgi:hypothetical protein
VVPENLGPRSEALKTRRSQARRKRFTAGTAAAVIAGLVAAGSIAYLAANKASDDEPTPEPTEVSTDKVITTLIFGTRESGGGAVWLTLLGYDRDSGSGTVLYIPAHAAVEVPGRGLQGVGDALESGGPPLLVVSAENLLGIDIDNYLELSDHDARLLFEATGPISIDVPSQVKVSVGKDRARLIFDSGLQRLGHLAFWESLFAAFAGEPDNLSEAVRSVAGALVESDAEAGDHARLMSTIAALDPTQRTLTTLPVHQVSVGGSELYATDPEEISTLLNDLLAGIASATEDETRVQVLNGNGVPGIGQEVAQKLIAAGFRVVLTGNARRLDYEKTLIITYDASEAGQALAERARKLIGVGEVQVSEQSQGIVDLTIVIGKDFLRTR